MSKDIKITEDFSNFEERYSEFLNENKMDIKNRICNAYDKYVYHLKQEVYLSYYAIAIAFPLFLAFALALVWAFSYENKMLLEVIIVIAIIGFPGYAFVMLFKLQDKIIRLLFLKYERANVIDRYVRPIKDYTLKSLMLKQELSGFLLVDKYISIDTFYEKCLEELKKEDFTFSVSRIDKEEK